MYNGLDIATNKLPIKERKSIPHHLLGSIGLKESAWEVNTFRTNALKLVDDIRSRGRIPILVGGTHYYTQALLFKDTIVEEDRTKARDAKALEHQWPILNASTSDMLEELWRIDPAMAARWHPNDGRKIRRSLEIYLFTGKRASEIYDEQRKREPRSNLDQNAGDIDSENHVEFGSAKEILSKTLLMFDTLIFWVYADLSVLSTRLEKRIDSMLANGLVSEAEAMYAYIKKLESEGQMIDQSCGICAAIGYKEFNPYLSAMQSADTRMEELAKLKQDGIERTRIETRRYAKSQMKWIRLKLLQALADGHLEKTLYLLDGSDLSLWPCNVESVAFDVTKSFLRGSPLPSPKMTSDTAERILVTSDKRDMYARYCNVCNKTLMSNDEWTLHVKGRKHQSAIKPKRDWRATHAEKSSGNWVRTETATES